MIAASAPTTSSIRCLALIEVNEHCNLDLPGLLCRFLAGSGPSHRSLAEVERMLDALVASEGEPDLVQISGGEPTLHPQILDDPRRRARAADQAT